jgi:redox-sensitive bicupin YhaK (pirin superfamily)
LARALWRTASSSSLSCATKRRDTARTCTGAVSVSRLTPASVSTPIPSDFQGFVYMLEGEASFGANRLPASRSQIAVLGPGETLAVEQAQPGTRFLLMAGRPYREEPVYNGPYVD